MTNTTDLLAQARDAAKIRDWSAAYACYKTAREQERIGGEDTYMLGDAAWWLGLFRESRAYYEEAFGHYEAEGLPRKCAFTALALAGSYFMRGEPAVGSGWMGRAMRLLSELPEGVEHAYILFMELEGNLGQHDYEAAFVSAKALQDAGRRFGDLNLRALGITGEGRVRLKQGRVTEGIALLDEAMLLAVSGGLAPEWAGNIYCTLMVACNDLADIRRAAEWTRATTQWCEGLGAAGPFTGVCRVHRAQVLRLQGSWGEAARHASMVMEELGDFDVATVAAGYYELGEIRRLAGEISAAEAAYLQAHAMGRDPQPGLSLLRLAQGRAANALTSIQSALAAEANDRLERARLCIALVEIAIAAGDIQTARQSLAELTDAAQTYGSSGLEASTLFARGAFELAEGAPLPALQTLRNACLLWQQLSVPYEVARSRVLLGQAYSALGDTDSAAMEVSAAGAVFRRLGALLDAERCAAMLKPSERPGGLSERETEVLALVAMGKSNREIAAALVISDKTVARHLSNILTKLDLSSRTAATAYAFQHGLVVAGSG